MTTSRQKSNEENDKKSLFLKLFLNAVLVNHIKNHKNKTPEMTFSRDKEPRTDS